MSDAEVTTTAIVAVLPFRGRLEAARHRRQTAGYIPRRLSKSHLNRRLHRLCDPFLPPFYRLGELWEPPHAEAVHGIECFSLAACDRGRIGRCQRHRGLNGAAIRPANGAPSMA